jgi:catalase
MQIDDGLAARVADGLGMAAMPAAARTSLAVLDMEPSPALQIIGKMKNTLEGRCIGILVGDGTSAASVAAIKGAASDAGATVKIIAPKIGGAKLEDGSTLPADGQLAGTPSVLFDAVAVLLSTPAAHALGRESAAIDFVRDAFGHLKAIAIDEGGQWLLQTAGVQPDGGVIGATDPETFIEAAKTRQWAREPSVRTLS